MSIRVAGFRLPMDVEELARKLQSLQDDSEIPLEVIAHDGDDLIVRKELT